MIPIIGALLGTLAENGLGLLSSAIQAKGKEVVENTLGIKIPDNPTPADVERLRELQYEHEERLLELGIEKAKLEMAELELLAKAAQNDAENITDRWQADMSSDSWLSKNIRPMSLMAIFSGFFLFAMMSAFGYNANESYVTLLGNWGQLIMGAYFAGRTIEKLAEMRSSK
jgi:phage-related minor tail protein